MSNQKSKQNISTSSIGASAITRASSDAILPRHRVVQNFLLIWVDASIDESTVDYQKILVQLRNVVNDVNIFTQSDQCVQFINEVEVEKVFVIVSGSLGQHLLPDIHALPQVDAIYLFCGNKSRHEIWTKQWVKIKGIHTEIKPICQALQQAAKQCNQDSIAVSFFTVNEAAFSQHLNQLEPSFIYTQIFKEILLEMKHDKKSIKDLVMYCRQFYSNNMDELTIIDEFEQGYRSKFPIRWYTRECFAYQMLNRALRTLESDTIINMGFFIRDLHQQIQELYKKQVGSYNGQSFIVYRGQGLLKTNFDKLMKSKNGLMSFNNFLSTSKNQDISLRFAKGALTKTNMVGILFKMSINPSVSSVPFASIREVSYLQTEEEILFSMHTIFRIGEINTIENNNSLYQVDLTLAADDDLQLRILTERIQKEVVGETGWKQLGQLLLRISQFDKAEELYSVLLEQTSDENEKALAYHQLGYIKKNQDDHEKAIEYYTKELEIKQKHLPLNHLSLVASYNNIGLVYMNMGDCSKALSFYEKALEIKEKTLPPDHPLLPTSYNNIGEIYRNRNMGDYSKVLSFYEKALGIFEKTLPSNHPDLATSYNNIGWVYINMDDYPKALTYLERAQNIWQTSLPPNHPEIRDVRESIQIVKSKLQTYM